jgi:hypothetical protein
MRVGVAVEGEFLEDEIAMSEIGQYYEGKE